MGKLAFLDMIETLFLKLGFLGDALNSLVQLDFTGARESAALAFGEVHTEYGVALERVQDDTDAAVAALAGRDYISEFGTQARALAGGLVDAAVDWVDPLLAEAAKRSAQAVVDGVAEADVGGANTEAILKNMDEFSITMDKVKQGIAGAFGGPEGLIADAKITVSDLSVVTTKAFNGMASSLTNFVMTGKADFKGFARSVITDITAMIVKAKLLQFLKMIPGLGDLITGAEVGETGGIVGKLGGPKAQVPSFMFAGAQEYAKGGAVPVLAHQGEGIFTPKQMDNADRLFASMAQAPATPPRVTVNISTPAGTEASVSQKQSGAGGQDLQMDVMVEQVENRMSQNIQSGGGLASTMEQQYGLDRSRGQYR